MTWHFENTEYTEMHGYMKSCIHGETMSDAK